MNVRILSLTAAIMLVPPIIGGISAQENANSEYIDKIQDVRDIAEDAGGLYFEGNDVPYIRGNQVALPIKNEATGKTLGYIVAEMDNLEFALEKAGYVGLASIITDSETERRNADSQSSKLTAVQSDTSSAKKEVTNMKETVSKEASIVTEEYYVQVGA